MVKPTVVYLVLIIYGCMCGYSGYYVGSQKHTKIDELINHTTLLTNVIAEQLLYEQSIARGCK